ncbi:MAG TPA: adenylate/guanylate cyclase domain-containing protein [Geminicoccus sp.]|jgi:class 3 adenylate cyclase|uniref:adenylate/guanylate cyclase domain-containing protein n=1 Tax=Geminicoccus sp. TaxID=2024832 RepID=UPI002E318FDE|nr:adenylate/guanylate cyclase domain-containing protein [Geminicoccus sp.]HEX2526445.1 adenylate/guanylate cyclase domain-containing protein [Geminicoccus sp.]
MPIAVALVVATAVLLSIAVGSVLVAGYRAARLNTAELVKERSEFLIRSVVERTRSHLEPVESQLAFLADLIIRHDLGLNRAEELGDHLLASLAALPQETVVAFATPDLQVLRAFRNRPAVPVAISDWREDPSFEQVMARASEASGPYWGEMFTASGLGMPFINLFVPVRRDGRFMGVLIAGVAVEELSEFLDSLGGLQLAQPFILYGDNAVLAHPSLRDGFSGLSDEHPLPTLEELGDPVLELIWAPDSERRLQWETSFADADVEVRFVDSGGQSYVFLLEEISGYGDRPWTIGTYLPLERAVPQLDRLTNLLWIGAIVLLAGLILAFVLGRSLSRPIHQLAAEANRLRDLDFEAPPPRLRGPFRELNEAASAFDAMVAGLRLFSTYVPRSLVRRLVRREASESLASEEHELSVMFTDIAGFTALSEHLPSSEVVAFLNRHFTLIEQGVEKWDGTVDKYIGDAVMAFWGAPVKQPDHALRACRAALDIAEAIAEDNRQRTRQGLVPVRARIGIHSGRAVVGDIGAPGRVNYTVVGDVVNVAERLEELARTAAQEDDDVSVLVSGTTAAQLDEGFELLPLGEHELRGRRGSLKVFQLRRPKPVLAADAAGRAAVHPLVR